MEPWIDAAGDRLYFNSIRAFGSVGGLPGLSVYVAAAWALGQVTDLAEISLFSGLGHDDLWVSDRIGAVWSTPRAECLDWVLVWNRRHLEQVVAEYVVHYNTARPHRGINLEVPTAASEPVPASVEQVRRIERVDVLGGLIHEYHHAA